MAKPELGTKRVCPACGTKYYDLLRSPILCPNCGTVYELSARERAVSAAAADEDEELEEEELETEAEVVSLAEVEDEEAAADEADDGTDHGSDAVPGVADDIELEATPGDTDAFLEDEEAEGEDDVTDIVGDVEGEDER